jgi:serine protease Do
MKNALLALSIVVPLGAGLAIGYAIGHGTGAGTESVSETPAGSAAGEPMSGAGGSAESQQSRDSLSDVISGSRRTAITRAVSAASRAVVGINVVELRQFRQWSPWGDDPFFRHFFGDQTYTERVQGLGSGFLVSPDGYILTNDHVAGNAKEITVTMTDGKQYQAKLVGSDLVTDIALLKVDGGNFPYLRLGSSDDVIIGEWVIALGNPFGLFQVNDKPTVTVGVVSATGMNLRAQEGRVYRGMIQTDAAINSGNSGGPLINSLGDVIGVNSVIYTPNQGNIGVGFAIPINRVKRIMAELRRNGKVERVFWTGLEIQPVDRRIARYFGLSSVEGVIVTEVKRGSPADRAGFKVEDVILEVNGEKIYDESSLVAIVDDAAEGESIRVKVFRNRKSIDLRLRLERRTI